MLVKKKSVKGYKLSFFLAVILLAAAFITKAFDKKEFGKLKSDAGSWFFLIGGLILLVYGYFEYRKIKNN